MKERQKPALNCALLRSHHSLFATTLTLLLSGINFPFAVSATNAYDYATHSSPIALSPNGRYVWSVNPGANSVSIIDTNTDKKIADVKLGQDKEPQSLAITPNGRYVFVANAKGNSVSVIRVKSGGAKGLNAYVDRELLTGAEPWNVVVSPDGKRAFVANSGQDTITVIDANRRRIIDTIKLRDSACNDPDRSRHFQPRGLAVTQDSSALYVTRFLSFTSTSGKQGVDDGKEGVVCRLDIDTKSRDPYDYDSVLAIRLAPQITGFKFPGNNNDTLAFPNQLQSIVIRGDQAYLPNIAASPSGPLRFTVDTHAFVSVITGVNDDTPKDAPDKFLNLHLGARDPEQGKTKLFFANLWGIAFTNQSGEGNAYAISSGSDLLVKLRVSADGKLNFTGDADTTRYIDLNDPANPATSNSNAGKNPQGIVIKDGNKAYVANFVSSNVSVVDLNSDAVIKAIRTAPLPRPGTAGETVRVGAEQFFSSRGHYNAEDSKGTPHTLSTSNRLSSEGWQACASCHFKGLTDGVIWKFETGPRKSIPLNATWNPQDRGDPGSTLNGDQRILNYSAVRDEVEDFELNDRNISGPGDQATAADCSEPPSAIAANPTQSLFDPNHGLFLGDVDPNKPPCAINNFNKSNTDRNQLTVSLPGSSTAVPSQTAMREWVRFAVRTPNAPLTTRDVLGGVSDGRIALGRKYFEQAGCQTCHGGSNWTLSSKDFDSPPALARVPTERTGTFVGNPVGAQFLAEILRDVESFNLGVTGGEAFLPNRPFGNNIGADEKTGNLANGVFLDALGFDYNSDGKGNGYNVPSLLGIHASPPYLHNGACETVSCVLDHVPHRTAGQKGKPDILVSFKKRRALAAFVESIDDKTKPF